LPAADAAWDNVGWSLAHGEELPRTADVYSNEHSQGGLAIRYHVKRLNLDTSLYALNLESRVPILGADKSSNPSAVFSPDPALLQAGAPVMMAAIASLAKTINYFWEYPGNIQTYGFNASTKLHGWRVTTELEYVNNLPVGRNAADFLTVLFGGGGPLQKYSTLLANGAYFRNYDRLHNVKADMNAARVFPKVLKAKQLVLFIEAQESAISNLPSLADRRYGRGFQWGYSTQGFGGLPACAAVTSPLSDNLTGCVNKGFVTATAFGYRTHVALNYEVGHGVTLSPVVTWAHDVRGNSADVQLVQGRGVISPALEWEIKKRYFGGVVYRAEATASTYNEAQDRNNLKLYTGINF
jgi:hypothetical protein